MVIEEGDDNWIVKYTNIFVLYAFLKFILYKPNIIYFINYQLSEVYKICFKIINMHIIYLSKKNILVYFYYLF